MKQIVLASTNQHKCIEIQSILKTVQVQLVSSYVDSFEVIEDGTTYEENALLKARKAYQLTKKPCIADDSGINIEALNGAPGIYSARFMGENTAYDIKNKVIIEACKTHNNFNASFTCVIAYINEDGKERVFRYDLKGTIANTIQGTNGFGYDPIFIPEGFNQTMAELPMEIKNSISHRFQALKKLQQHLTGYQLNVVLIQPHSPDNVANIMRTCAATNITLHLINPGFKLDEKRIRRVAMDYIDFLDYNVYDDFEQFKYYNPSSNYYFSTRYSTKPHSEFQFPDKEKVYFMFGNESTGIDYALLKQYLPNCMRIPMNAQARSLNLSNCVAIVVYEALRQQDFKGLSKTEIQKGEDFLERGSI